MAEPGGGGGGNVSEGANGVPSTLLSALDKIVIKENDEEKGKERNGGKCKTDNTNNGGVSNGDCVIEETQEDSGSAQPESPGADKGNKPGLPRRSSIIKACRAAFVESNTSASGNMLQCVMQVQDFEINDPMTTDVERVPES